MDLFNEEEKSGIASGIPVRTSGKPVQRKRIENNLAGLKSDELKTLYKFLFRKTTAISKAELIRIIGECLCFPTVGRFKEWFFALPDLIQKIYYRGTFSDYIPVPVLEKELGTSIASKDTRYSWEHKWKILPELGSAFLSLHEYYGCLFISIPGFLREILTVWLVPPVSVELPDCRITDKQERSSPEHTSLERSSTESRDNSLLISDIYPLLCDALLIMMEGMGESNPEKAVRNGFKKREINELRVSTGFLPFKMENEDTPSGIDIASRFILCMHNFKPKRPKDGHEGIRELVQNFFSEKSIYPKSWDFPDRAYIEYNICIDHLSRTPGYYLEHYEGIPPSRKIFRDILLYVAGDGNWFDADKLAEYIRLREDTFLFCDRYIEYRLKVKGETINLDELTLTSGYEEEFHPDGVMRYYLLIRPLLKAYCYIFAALGLLEITQESPPLVRTYRKKQYPFSIYDSLRTIRITELGRWCLGLTDERPPKPSHDYQAIADRELFLVTVQGNSLERRVYLDRIGQHLGEDRWRISPASFIAGCINKHQITDRIERFKSLIDPNPAPHWEQLFRKVIDRAGLFDVKRSDMMIFNLPEDREIQEELLRDPEIKRIIRRVEGRMVVVSARDQSKFYALLGEHGIAHF